MINWIKGQDLIEYPHKFNKQELFKFVQEGVLVPYYSPDAGWIKEYELFTSEIERMWRVFPTPEIQKQWVMEVFLKKGQLEEAQDWLSKSDEEHIEDHKHDLQLDWNGDPPKYLSDLETFIDRDLPLLRQKYLREKEELPAQIKSLEEEFAANRVWKNLDLGPAQYEMLIEKLLDASYPLEQVKAISRKQSPEEAIEGGAKEFKVSQDTKWEDIEIILTANETVRIITPQYNKLCNYNQLGLVDKRNLDKPTVLWNLLMEFGRMKGFIPGSYKKFDRRLPDRIERLNRHFKNLFGMHESMMFNYMKEGGYKTKIKFKSQLLNSPQSVSESSNNNSSKVICQMCKAIYDLKDHPDECPVCFYLNP